MRILYLGNFRHDWCTEVHIARELEALGHTVDRFQEPPGGGDLVTLEDIRLRALDGCDLVLWTRTWGLPPEATHVWRGLERHGIVTASYHLDLYVGLKRQAGLEHDPFWTTGYVFTPDGSTVAELAFKQLGINHRYMAPAVVSDECYRATPNPERWPHDVVFVGTPAKGYHPEWKWRRQLLDWLAEYYGDRFKRWGGGDLLVRGADLNELYATVPVVVGDSLDLDHYGYFSDRYFETIGRGGFLLGLDVPGIEDYLVSGRHFISYEKEDYVKLRETIDWAIENREAARRIANAGQNHVRLHHTYQHRLEQALATMGF